ncbi:hypothetical protein FQA39_LY08773 [Lamprigera yunnana]|nr:hypothetical protein FQA39_LY08773 [Lamprigera yunnana]
MPNCRLPRITRYHKSGKCLLERPSKRYLTSKTIIILEETGEVEEQTKIEGRNDNCKEDKMMQMLIQLNNAILNKLEQCSQKLKERNCAMFNKLEESNQKLEERNCAMFNKLEEIHQKLDETKAEITTEKCEKKYIELDCKMVEREKQVENNAGHVDGKCKGLREFTDVDAKMNQDTEDKIQICKDLKEQSKDIVNYIEERTEIWNSTANKMIIDYKEREYISFQESRKGFMRNYWGIKEESVMKSELYGTKFNHSLRHLQEELQNKVMIIETKKFDELEKILKAGDHCERDRKRDDGSKYNSKSYYNNYHQRKQNYGDQENHNHNYF